MKPNDRAQDDHSSYPQTESQLNSIFLQCLHGRINGERHHSCLAQSDCHLSGHFPRSTQGVPLYYPEGSENDCGHRNVHCVRDETEAVGSPELMDEGNIHLELERNMRHKSS